MKTKVSFNKLIIMLLVLFLFPSSIVKATTEWIPYEDNIGIATGSLPYWKYDTKQDMHIYRVGDILDGLIRIKKINTPNHKYIYIWEVKDDAPYIYNFKKDYIDTQIPIYKKNQVDMTELDKFGGHNLKDLIGDYLIKNGYEQDDLIRLAITTSNWTTEGNIYYNRAALEYIKGTSPLISVGIRVDNWPPSVFPITILNSYESVGVMVYHNLTNTLAPDNINVSTALNGNYMGSFNVSRKSKYFHRIDGKNGGRVSVNLPTYIMGGSGMSYINPIGYVLYKPKEIVEAKWEVDNKYLNIGDNTKFKASIVGENLVGKKIIIKNSKGPTYYNGLYENFTNELDIDEGIYSITVDIYNKENELVYTIPPLKVSKINILNNIISNISKSNFTHTLIINDFNRYFEPNQKNIDLINQIKLDSNLFLLYANLSDVLKSLLEKL